MTHLVFVYGTLKRGFWNNGFLTRSRYVSDAVTTDKFVMVSGPFPVVRKNEFGHRVKGELWEVDAPTLARLDRLEGFRAPGSDANHYDRELVELEPLTIHRDPVWAFMYIGGRFAGHGMHPYTTLDEDDFLDWKPDPFFRGAYDDDEEEEEA